MISQKMKTKITDMAKKFVEQYEFADMDKFDISSYSDKEIKQLVIDTLRSNCGKSTPRYNLNRLRQELFYLGKLHDNNYYKYYEIVSWLLDCLPADVQVKNISDVSWLDAISYIKKYIKAHGNQPIGEFDCQAYVEYAQNLQDMGAEICIENSMLSIENYDDMERLLIAKVADICVFDYYKYLVDCLTYHDDVGIYIPKDINHIMPERLPLQYLINLSKHCASVSKIDHGTKIDEVFSLARNLIAVQHTIPHFFSFAPARSEEILDQSYLESFVNYRNYYYIKQCSLKYVCTMINYINENIHKHVHLNNPDLACFVQLSSMLASLSEKGGLSELAPDIEALLAEIPEYSELVQDIAGDNSDKLLRPILLVNGKHYLLPKPISACLMLHAVIAILEMRSKHNNERGKLGYLYESFIRDQLREKGINPYSGRYKYKLKYVDNHGKQQHETISGESDAILELEHTIVSLEIKKRLLSESSGLIDTVGAIVGLRGSLLYSAFQNFKTECIFKQHGEISLRDKLSDTCDIIKRNGRSILKISLSLGDYSNMQGMAVSINLISMFDKFGFTLKWQDSESADTDRGKHLTKEFEKLHKLQKRVSKFLDLYGANIELNNTYFMSFHDFLFILNLAGSLNQNDYCLYLERLLNSVGRFHASGIPVLDYYAASRFLLRSKMLPRYEFIFPPEIFLK